jgi:hypothetical protein
LIRLTDHLLLVRRYRRLNVVTATTAGRAPDDALAVTALPTGRYRLQPAIGATTRYRYDSEVSLMAREDSL